MATATTAQGVTGVRESYSGAIPWYLWCGVIAITSVTIGGAWDVAWHRSIGRDTFWTPAHIAIYACGVLAAITCGYLILASTFGHDRALQSRSVHLLGFRAPLGAFLAAWGGMAMLTSAPFDNWWHNAYGLDVKIVSPPHVLLILGIRIVSLGFFFLTLAALNRAARAGEASGLGEMQPGYRGLQRILLFLAGTVLCGQLFLLQEYTWDTRLHQVLAYIALAMMVPIALAVFSRATRNRWAATWMSVVYLIYGIGQILILPLVPATPKLGPVYYQVTHLVPAQFPVLVIVPAFALDLLWQRTIGKWKLWQVAVVSGVVFVAVMVAVEWPFADFLMSPLARNAFFGADYFGYNTGANSYNRLHLFLAPDSGIVLWSGLVRAALYASLGTWLGMLFGNWMRKVQR
jgi:hypothetical protein